MDLELAAQLAVCCAIGAGAGMLGAALDRGKHHLWKRRWREWRARR